MYNWNSIKKVRIAAYIILATNVGLGLFFVNSKSKSTIHHGHTDGKIGYIHAKRGVKLRQEANANSNFILSIGNGESVVILNDTSILNKGWVQIKYNDSIGWIWKDYLSK
jgi:uncharacterized protein YgiM (DUF1202 family)